MSNIIYISKKCQYSKQLLIMIYKNPMLKEMFRIVCVENSPIPPFIKTVPTLFNDSNNSVISGTDLFNLINSYVEQHSGQEHEPVQSTNSPPPKNSELSNSGGEGDEELAPWNIGEMGGGMSSNYSFLDNENPIQNSFELIGEGDTGISPNGAVLPKPEMSGGDIGSDKRSMFDNDYDKFIKSRNDGIPQSNSRA